MNTLEESFGWEQTFLELKDSDALQLQPQARGELGHARPLQVPSAGALSHNLHTNYLSFTERELCFLRVGSKGELELQSPV